MFTRNNVPVRISNITPELMEHDDAEVALVRLACEVNPLTAELAGEIHDIVRGTLYTLSGAEVNSLISGISFALPIPPQAIEVRSAPDTKKPTYAIDEAKISNIHAKRSKKSASWTLAFTVTFAYASEHQLAQVMECYTRTKFLTFAPAEPGLFDETPEVKGRGVSQAETDGADEGDIEVPDGAHTH